MGGGTQQQLDLGDGTSDWVIRSRTYRGLIGSAAAKLVHRKITTNENITNLSSVIVNLPAGWSDARKGSVSFPRVAVEDTVITTIPPPTTSIPGTFTPFDPPIVKIFPISGDLTWNWPPGWKLSAINSDELFRGARLYLQSLSYEYVWPAQL